MRRTRLRKYLKDLRFRFYDDNVTALSAELAYYLLLSFFPFLIFLMTVISYSPVSRAQVLTGLEKVLPDSTYQLIKDIIINAVISTKKGFLPFSILATIWAASIGVNALIRGINKAYDEEENRPYWKVKGVAVLFTIALVFIVLFSFILLIFGEHIKDYVANKLQDSGVFIFMWNTLRYLFMPTVTAITFSILYFFVPSRKLEWKEVVPGSIFATVGWLIASAIFSLYVNSIDYYSRVYGSIGGVIVLLIWLFISAMIIILGGEINAVLVFDKEGKHKPKGKKYWS